MVNLHPALYWVLILLFSCVLGVVIVSINLLIFVEDISLIDHWISTFNLAANYLTT